MAEFTKVLPASCLRGSGLVLPPDFRDAVVPESGEYFLQNEAGQQWRCSITRKSQNMHERCDITGGWRAFAAANGLAEGMEIHVKHMGGNLIQIVKTGRMGVPRTPKTPAAGKTPGKTPAKTPGKTPRRRSSNAAKTPGSGPESGGVAKRRGGSSSGSKKAAAVAAAAATPLPAAEPADMDGEAAAAEEQQAAGGGSWCSIM